MKKNIHYPMLSGGGVFNLSDIRAAYFRILKRYFGVGVVPKDVSDNNKDRIGLAFDEYPACEMCGSTHNKQVLIALDNNRIVECENCGLWYTSPRVNEQAWMNWLGQIDADRNIEFTENRLRYGVALNRNIPYGFSFWWKIKRYKSQNAIKEIIKKHGGDVRSLHDVGCGVGFVIKSAMEMGFESSGNDLNAYAIERMRDLFDMNVHLGQLSDLVRTGVLPKNENDIVIMHDCIEHFYHPLAELTAAFSILKEGGILHLTTFSVDTDIFRGLGNKWDMLMWNHVFHFSSKSLVEMVKKAGFKHVDFELNQRRGAIEICARKS